ncbi:hypothetical protein [Photobacterium galatheae]|uniref:Secreted protein n=1 Tax=Photobacterium galatheae TaxID=1654360 RepID=A0A066RQW1_9GAMM|nr:hypothetical protein [Photobacterium galatheae]KDM92835.1 hypothetical protein EA58_03500 [Photobacterium galatheae]MCM0148200.1 hypothetical protein [Photobacterium galatheae]
MKKMMKLSLILACTVYSQASLAEACSQNYNELPDLVGLDSSSGRIFASVRSSTNECSCTHVRFTKENTDTNTALSILLAAKMANKKVRVDLKDKTDCDTAYRVYVH